MVIETLTGPNGELVNEGDFLAHLGLPASDGPVVRPYLAEAVDQVDGDPTKSLTGSCFRDRVLRLTIDLFAWQPVIWLPGPPTAAVQDVEWELAGTWRSLEQADYRLRQSGRRWVVVVERPDGWPVDGARVRVTYEAGSRAAPPKPVQAAVKHLAAELFAVRSRHLTDEDGVTGPARTNPATMRLLRPFITKLLIPNGTATPV